MYLASSLTAMSPSADVQTSCSHRPLPSYLEALIQVGIKRQFRTKAVIVKEGDEADVFYILLKGVVQTYSQSVTGKVLTHSTITEGHYFGEMALDGGKRSASVQALEDCECVLVPNTKVLDFASKNLEFATHLLHTVIARARSSTEAAKNMALSDVYKRLWLVLSDEFKTNDGICTLTHQRIADQIGASREMVSRLLKDLALGGYIQSIQRQQIQQLKKIPMRW
jgi:CRP/FNR family transcriptional regulator, cyclic AMP receptor protein